VLEQRVRVVPSKVQRGASAGNPVARYLANSLEVTVLYRVLSATGLAHHRFSATSSASAGHPTSRAASLLGSSPGDLGQNLSACPHPLLRFHSPTEFDQLALPRTPTVAGTEAPSMGFVSLRRRQLVESTSPGLASPGTFRSQVFATSQRVSPPRAWRVCFTPLTSLGFCPPEHSPRRVP